MSDYGTPPPPPPPPPSYSSEGMGGGAPVDHPRGITILVLGILSLVCCSPLGIVAFFMANSALQEIDAAPGRYGNRQIVVIGRILGIIGMVFLVLTLLWVIFLGGLATLSGSNN